MTKSPLLLLAEDDKSLSTVTARALRQAGFSVQATDTLSTLWQWLEAGQGDLLLSDVTLPDGDTLDVLPRIQRIRPDLPVVVMSANTTVLTALKSGERGAFEYLPKPFDLDALIEVCRRAVAERDAAPSPPPKLDTETLPIIGRSAAMQEVYQRLARLTNTDLTVLISGESGTGKELVAQALHRFSRRASGSFLALNMAAIPADLIEAELFGYEKGAFTGASQRKEGYFERADGGTLFLDEIGDMPLDAQTRLLRVLQNGRLTRVGGRGEVEVDVRILAATNKTLEQRVQEGTFRQDLFYRLNVVPLHLPALRERKADIADLVRHFVHRNADKEGLAVKHFSAAALQRLSAYDWPGNVRELENLVVRAQVLSPSREIQAGDLDFLLPQTSAAPPLSSPPEPQSLPALRRLMTDYLGHYERLLEGTPPPPGLYQQILREVEAPLIELCLRLTGGNQLKAAAILGLNRNTLRKKITELEIDMDAAAAEQKSKT